MTLYCDAAFSKFCEQKQRFFLPGRPGQLTIVPSRGTSLRSGFSELDSQKGGKYQKKLSYSYSVTSCSQHGSWSLLLSYFFKHWWRCFSCTSPDHFLVWIIIFIFFQIKKMIWEETKPKLTTALGIPRTWAWRRVQQRRSVAVPDTRWRYWRRIFLKNKRRLLCLKYQMFNCYTLPSVQLI